MVRGSWGPRRGWFWTRAGSRRGGNCRSGSWELRQQARPFPDRPTALRAGELGWGRGDKVLAVRLPEDLVFRTKLEVGLWMLRGLGAGALEMGDDGRRPR